MPSKILAAILVVALLGAAACGSSGKGASSTSGGSAGAASSSKHGGKSAAPSRTYRLRLTGKAETPPGAPAAAGNAVIALHGRTLKVCWRFSHLRGFTGATFAHIHRGTKGISGPIVVPLSTATKLHHKGCVHAAAAVIKAIEKGPHGYYVNIHSKQHPAGAVRSQL